MSVDKVVIDLDALNLVANTLREWVINYSSSLEKVSSAIGKSSSDWCDEDFSDLVAFIESVSEEFDKMREKADELILRTNKKIEAVRQLHAMKISR